MNVTESSPTLRTKGWRLRSRNRPHVFRTTGTTHVWALRDPVTLPSRSLLPSTPPGSTPTSSGSAIGLPIRGGSDYFGRGEDWEEGESSPTPPLDSLVQRVWSSGRQFYNCSVLSLGEPNANPLFTLRVLFRRNPPTPSCFVDRPSALRPHPHYGYLPRHFSPLSLFVRSSRGEMSRGPPTTSGGNHDQVQKVP